MSEHHRRFFFYGFPDFWLTAVLQRNWVSTGLEQILEENGLWENPSVLLEERPWLVGGFKHDFYFPFHIWDIIRNPLTFIFFKMVKTINQLTQWSPQAWPQSRCFRTVFLPRMVSRLVPSFFLDFTEIERNHGCFFFKWENPYSNGWELPPLKWKPPRGLTLIILLKKKQGYNRRRIRG